MSEKRRNYPSHDEWDKQNTKRMSLKFNLHTDADILDRLAAQESVLGYIKRLIRDDIARERAE